MIAQGQFPGSPSKAASELSLFHLLDPDVLADPYPLYHRLQTENPVFWDSYMHAWVVTRYADVIRVLRDFSAERIRTVEQLNAMDLSELNPMARVMVKQMLFMDPPAHKRIRGPAKARSRSNGSSAAASRSRAIRSRSRWAPACPCSPTWPSRCPAS